MKRLLVFLILWLPVYAHAALNVFACEPEWAALAKEIGGDDVRVYAATTAMQDPHRIEARPSLIAQMRRANLVVCTGADLEVGWLPVLLQNANNAAVQPGRPGYFEAARFVPLLEKPARLDRADGDVHAAGNPHIHLDPRNILRVSEALAKRLAEIDPANAAHYAARQKDFASRMRAAIARWEAEAAGLRGVPVVVHHKNWSYLVNWLGLRMVADLEPRPGVDPSPAHLAQLLDRLKTQPARMVLRAAYQSPKASEWIARRSGMKAVELPYTVGGSPRARDLFSLFDDTLTRLNEAAR